MSEETDENKPIMRDLHVDDDPEVTEIESLCVECEEQGMTRLLLTKIPYFRDVIISSFSCDHCGNSNSELLPAETLQDKGIKISITISDPKDLDRNIVVQKYATVSIPEVELDIPPSKGNLTTIEGIIQKTVDELLFNQPVRKALDPDTGAKIDLFIEKLKDLQNLKSKFTVLIDDPSGNSFVENPIAPHKDEATRITHYTRTKEQDQMLGLNIQYVEPDEEQPDKIDKDEIFHFQINCPNCNALTETRMKSVDIPHFKEIILMATTCDECGHKESEVKSSGAIEPKGKKITLKLTDSTDLSRDVLKSETCKLCIPELEFETESGTLNGQFTTIEGLLNNVKHTLYGSNPFIAGDSSQPQKTSKLKEFCDKIDEIMTGKKLGVHIILEDPAGNSYIQNLYAPDPDPELEIEEYERSFEDKEDLGLNDLKTENYENDAPLS